MVGAEYKVFFQAGRGTTLEQPKQTQLESTVGMVPTICQVTHARGFVKGMTRKGWQVLVKMISD